MIFVPVSWKWFCSSLVATTLICSSAIAPARAYRSDAVTTPTSTLNLPPGQAIVERPVAISHPEGVVYRYATLMSHHDYADAYDLLSPDLQTQLPYKDFLAKFGAAGDTIQILDMVLQPETSSSDRLDYQVLMERDEAVTDAHPQVQEFVLVPPPHGDGNWRIDQINNG